MRLGALEAGGTKMVCAIGDESGKIYEQVSIPTETPEITMPRLISYFEERKIEALGIGCFGPIDPDKKSETYGSITSTPKRAWADYNSVGTMEKSLMIPVGFDTDVNGSVLGEVTFGQAKGKKCVVYVTIGTGVGAGIYIEGKLLHGMLHPEAGHILLTQRQDDTYEGTCPYHKTCLEGLAAGPAIEARWGRKAVELKDDARVWDLEAYYIAQAIVNYILILSPQMIILGGGVMHQLHLFPKIRRRTLELLNGYVAHSAILEDIDNYIVPPALGDNAGAAGALLLALEALKGA